MTLNEGQYKIYKEALTWFKSKSSEQVFEIDGLAGTGKSVLMHEILRGLNLAPSQYMPMAYTGQAAIVMRTKGFTTAKSIHSSLYEVIEIFDKDKVHPLYGAPVRRKKFVKKEFIDPDIRLFFIDEAYMVPSNMVQDILSFGIKVIVCGDAHQLPPIGGDPAFLTDHTRVHHLTELMRQSKDDPIVYIANRIINGDPIHNGSYGNSVMVINDIDFLPEMFGFADVVLTGTNRMRYSINDSVRMYMGYTGQFPEFNERLICRQNNWNLEVNGISLANGLTGWCSKPPSPDSTTYKYFTIDFKPDLLPVPFRDVKICIDYFLADEQKRKYYKSIWNRKINYMEGEFFEFAYALTTHLSQGAEYEKGIIMNEYMRPQIQKQLEYTAVTRFKKACIIVRQTKGKATKMV